MWGKTQANICFLSHSKLFPSTIQSSDSPIRPNLFGVDHELLNKQIMDYKKMKVSRHTQNFVWTEKQQQQLSKIQKKMKKKKARNPPDDDDVMPQKRLLDRYEADYWDDNTESASDCELQDELQEEVNELDVDDDKTWTHSTGKRKWSEKATPFEMKAANHKKKTAIATERLILYMFTTYSFKQIDLPRVSRFASTKYVRKTAITDMLLGSFQAAAVEGLSTRKQFCNDKIYLLEYWVKTSCSFVDYFQ